MTINLKDIPRLLLIIKKFEKDQNVKPIRNEIKKAFNNLPIVEITYPNFEKIEDFCLKTEILKFKENYFQLTELAQRILD